MSAILIVFCHCNKVMTFKTKNFANTSNKRIHFSYISDCFTYNINHSNTKVSHKFQCFTISKFNLVIFTFFTVLD